MVPAALERLQVGDATQHHIPPRDRLGDDVLRPHLVEHVGQAQDLVPRQVGLDALVEGGDELGHPERHGRRLQLRQDRLQRLLLAPHPSDVGLGVVAEPHVALHLLAVQVLAPLLQVDVELPPVVIIVHVLLDIDRDPIDGVHEMLHRPELDQHIVVHVNPEELIDGRPHEIDPAEAIRIVDLVEPVPGDFDPHVPRNREHPRPLRGQVQADDHHRVGAGASGVGEIMVGPVAVQAHAEDVDAGLSGEELLRVERGLDQLPSFLGRSVGLPLGAIPQATHIVECRQAGDGHRKDQQAERRERAAEELLSSHQYPLWSRASSLPGGGSPLLNCRPDPSSSALASLAATNPNQRKVSSRCRFVKQAGKDRGRARPA